MVRVGPHNSAAGCSRLSGHGGGVQPVGHRHDSERRPDTGADRSADDRRPAQPEVVIAGHVAVDGQSHQGEDADQPHAVVDRVGQLAGEVAERPVLGVRGPAEQRQRRDEADVGQRQVADVVVGDGLGAQLAVSDDDVEDQRVAGDAEHERQQVGDEDDDSGGQSGRVVEDKLRADERRVIRRHRRRRSARATSISGSNESLYTVRSALRARRYRHRQLLAR